MAPRIVRSGALLPNVRRFLAFRVLFNARFYYPVLAVLFVDLGLTLDQFALLNVAWAASIVLCELPLGAVADKVGRKPLIVGAAVLMVVEMAVMAFAPTGDATLLFWVFMVNRVLSGLAEAAASGADEALAYDSMVAAGNKDDWPRVLSRLQYVMSASFVFAMVVGAVVYDNGLVNSVLGTSFDQQTTARFPVYLTLAMSFGALFVALRMTEPDVQSDPAELPLETGWRGVAQAARWIVATRFALVAILFFLVLDSPMRIFMTMQASYFRMVEIPESMFGVIFAVFSSIGIFAPRVATALVKNCAPAVNFLIVAVIVMLGLFGAAFSSSWIGVLWVLTLSWAWALLSFFSSHYLNAVTDSGRRATVLSFKSLAGNLTYGAAGWAYALLFAHLGGGTRPPSGSAEEMEVLAQTLVWIPATFGVLSLPLFLWALRSKKMCSV
jgi:MFS family permease